MRFWILIFCTLLSLPGLLAPFWVGYGGLIQALPCLARGGSPDCLFALAGSAGYALVSLAAWIAYFKLAYAWVEDVVLPPRWPVTGFLLGILGMNAGGMGGTWVPYLGVFVLPALLLALWVSVYHLRCWRRPVSVRASQATGVTLRAPAPAPPDGSPQSSRHRRRSPPP